MTDRAEIAALVRKAGGNEWLAADYILEWMEKRR